MASPYEPGEDPDPLTVKIHWNDFTTTVVQCHAAHMASPNLITTDWRGTETIHRGVWQADIRPTPRS